MQSREIIAFFDRYADKWDERQKTDRYKTETILNSVPVQKGQSVLDIGCGTGVMLPFYLEREVKDITAVDISYNMTAIARRKFESYQNISVLTADAQEHPFNCRYDVCMVFNAFPHFDRPETLINNMYRALKPDGVICICHDRGREELKKHHSGEVSRISNIPVSGTALKAMLESAGFAVKTVRDEKDIFIVTGVKKEKLT